MEKHIFLAFDLGATSGRSILGTVANGKVEIKELTRFPNAVTELHGKYYWNLMGLYQALREGLVACNKEGIVPESIGIDTWGVDVVPIGEDGSILSMPRAYRDPYTVGMPERFFEKVSREKVYEKTGIQIMNFNTLYQIFAGMETDYVPMKQAKYLLFMPDALAYMLTGEKVCEYTISSTSQILDPRTKDFDKELLEAAGVDASVFSKPVFPGTVVGTLTDALAQYSRLGKVNVVSVAGHDTASAVAAVPALDENFAYLSSGTWSLMGIESKEPVITPETYELNYTNEGGVEGTTRFLKNICGMWILEQCRKEWTLSGKDYSYPEIVEMAMSATPFKSFIQPDDPSFANPPSMLEAINAFCERTGQEKPENDAQVIRLIFESLALRYRQVLEDLDRIATHPIERLHIIGGGSKNRLLNQLTANAIGRKVIAGPSEATAIGNVMIQAMAAGVVSSLQEMRSIIHASVETEEFAPELVAEWEEAYQKFVTLK
jgi:rhamnulokinase